MVNIFGFPKVFGGAFGTQRSVGVTLDQLISASAPLLDLKHNETSGTTVRNTGTLAATADGVWTAGAGALGQTGNQSKANEAYDYDGAASLTTVPAVASLYASTALTLLILCKPDTAGEGNAGTPSSSGRHQWRIPSTVNLPSRLFITSDATAGNSVTADTFVATGVWQMFIATFDNAGDRKIRIYKGVGGVLTEATYGTQTAMTGTLNVASSTQVVGNVAAATQTFDGLIDRFTQWDRVITPAEMQAFVTAAA